MEDVALGFLFTQIFKTVEPSSSHCAPYIEWDMLI